MYSLIGTLILKQETDINML